MNDEHSVQLKFSGGGGNNFEGRNRPQNKLYITGKKIYWRVGLVLNIGEICLFREFIINFLEIGEIQAIFGSSKIIRLIEHKHCTHHFEVRGMEITNTHNFFREIFKFRDFKKAFMNFARSIIARVFAILNISQHEV